MNAVYSWCCERSSIFALMMHLLTPRLLNSQPRKAQARPQASSSGRGQAPPFRAPIPAEQRVADFRFWHDEKRFRGSGDESLAQHILLAAGGIRMGGNPKAAPVQGLMGWQVVDSWDILWSTSDGAHKAAPFIKPQQGQLINALPGLESLTRKRNLALTLHAAYGEDAWQFVPRTYSLPSQLVMWRQRLVAEAKHLSATADADAAATAADTHASDGTSSSSSRPLSGQHRGLNTGSRGAAESASDTAAAAAAAGDIGQVTGWWALKTGQHLGQGLEVMPSSRALSSMLARNAPYLKETAAQKERQQQQQQQQQQSKLAGEPQARPEAQQQQQQQRQAVSGRVPQQPGRAAAGAEGLEEPAEASSSSNIISSSVTRTAAPSDTSNPPRPFISVQQYITQPLLINRRKFGLRIWVLVIGPKPYRAYVYRQGLVLFSSQQYNPDLSVVQTQGAASQGHLTNAALWGPEQQHNTRTSSNAQASGSSSRSSSSISDSGPADPAQQPVWSLQQLFDVLGQQQAEEVWEQIMQTAEKVVSAAAGPVADAAQQLRSDGDAAFELLGFDFLLDSSYKPWLLEVNASPSLAWNTPGQPGATELMYNVKQRMLTEMFTLLRLQDRYPVSTASARPVASGATAGAAREQQQDVNPVLVQAASEAYFSSRPQVAQLVARDAAELTAAIAAAPERQHVEAAVKQLLRKLLQPAQSALFDGFSRTLPPAASAGLSDQQQCVTVLQEHLQLVVQVECELQSCGSWVSLLQHFSQPHQAAGSQAGVQHDSPADAAIQLWLQVRHLL